MLRGISTTETEMTFYYSVERALKLLLRVVPGEPHKQAGGQPILALIMTARQTSDPGLFLALRRETHLTFHTIYSL